MKRFHKAFPGAHIKVTNQTSIEMRGTAENRTGRSDRCQLPQRLSSGTLQLSNRSNSFRTYLLPAGVLSGTKRTGQLSSAGASELPDPHAGQKQHHQRIPPSACSSSTSWTWCPEVELKQQRPAHRPGQDRAGHRLRARTSACRRARTTTCSSVQTGGRSCPPERMVVVCNGAHSHLPGGPRQLHGYSSEYGTSEAFLPAGPEPEGRYFFSRISHVAPPGSPCHSWERSPGSRFRGSGRPEAG